MRRCRFVQGIACATPARAIQWPPSAPVAGRATWSAILPPVPAPLPVLFPVPLYDMCLVLLSMVLLPTDSSPPPAAGFGPAAGVVSCSVLCCAILPLMPKMTKAQRRRHRQQLARQRAAAAPSAAPPPVRARPVAARRARRGVVRGWSASGLSRFCDWLRSVDLARLDDSAVRFTLAFEDCPPPPAVARLLSALGDSLRKARRRPASRYLLWFEFRSGYPVVSGLAFCACPATDLAADVCGHGPAVLCVLCGRFCPAGA